MRLLMTMSSMLSTTLLTVDSITTVSLVPCARCAMMASRVSVVKRNQASDTTHDALRVSTTTRRMENFVGTFWKSTTCWKDSECASGISKRCRRSSRIAEERRSGTMGLQEQKSAEHFLRWFRRMCVHPFFFLVVEALITAPGVVFHHHGGSCPFPL